MNTLQAIARILTTEGVEWIGCFPSNNLIETAAQEGIRPLMFRQERGALMAADGFSRLNNRKKFGVVITTGGAGEAIRLLLAAKKPLIQSGMGTLLAGASAELRELAELLDIPVYCTMPGKSGFDERHPLALGSGSGATGLHARTWIQECDVL